MSQLPPVTGDGRRNLLVAVVGVGLIQAAALGAAAIATRNLFAQLHTGEQLPSAAIAILAVAGVCAALARGIERTLAEWLGHSYAVSLRHELYHHLAKAEHETVSEKRLGALGLRFVGDLTAARNWVGLGITRLVSVIFIIPAALTALWILNSTLAKQSLVPLVTALIIACIAAVGVERLHRRLRSKRSTIAIDMIERVAVATELDSLGRTPSELKRLRRDGDELKLRATKRRAVVDAMTSVPAIGVALAGVFVVATAFDIGASGAEVAGMLAVLAILAVPMQELVGIWDRRCAWKIASAKIDRLLTQPEVKRRTKWLKDFNAIHFERVQLRNINIDATFKSGDKILVESEPGAGKSSLFRLLADLEQPSSGQLRFDDTDSRPKTMYLNPSSPILRGSLRRAATMGITPRPSDRQIIATLEQLGLSSLLSDAAGLSSRIGESGRTLSDTERLRLLVARALLSRAPLLLLDFPAHDDPLIIKACEVLLQQPGKTVFMTNHGVDRSLFDQCYRIAAKQESPGVANAA